MENELIVKDAVGPGKQKPEPNKEEAKQTLDKNTPSLSSSSSSSLEFSIDENDDLFIDGPAGYDPARIPASVFAAKPSNPNDWSAASTDSLFSINVGNNSFSIGDLDDWNDHGNVPENSKANDSSVSSGLPTVDEDDGAISARASSVSKASNENSLDSSSIDARFSGVSGKSDISFAFPVLVGNSVRTESMRRDTSVTEKPHLQEQVSSQLHSDHTNGPERSWLSRYRLREAVLPEEEEGNR